MLAAAGASRRERGADYGTLPAVVLPCEMVLTTSNGEFIVRCRCMALTRQVPSARFYGYDWLGTTRNAAEAPAIWRAHRGEVLRKQEQEQPPQMRGRQEASP